MLIAVQGTSAMALVIASATIKSSKALDWLFHLDSIDQRTILIGLLTIILIILLEKTSLKALGMVVALILAALIPGAFQFGGAPSLAE